MTDNIYLPISVSMYLYIYLQCPRNVLICNGIAKIADFGTFNQSTLFSSTANCERKLAYIDPLSFANTSYKGGKKSDIFSLGVILWQISSGKLPCEGTTTSKSIIEFRLKGSRDKPVPDVPEGYVELYSECWSQN